MLVQLTNAGAALLNANAGPIQLSTAKLGSAFGYIPAPTDNNIHGSTIYTGAPSQYFVVNANVVKYSVYLDYNLGPFQFGELGLFTSNGTLFALAANDELLSKVPISAGSTGNSIRLDIYLSMVGTNYEMWLDYAETSNQFRMAVLGSVDSLPPPQNATPNAYVITGKGAGQSSFLAYTDRSGLWNFDAYAYANQATATIKAFDSQSVTIALTDYVTGMTPAYLGEVIAEFSTGALYGICRYVSSTVISGNNVTLGFDNPLMQTPIVGDKVVVFGRQQLSTTIPNLPIASTSTLGAVIIGPTLTVDATGLINVASTSFPVTSVNNKTGAVVLTATDITGFATVATTGSYNDLINKPTPYTLPIATQSTLGGVKAPFDTNLTIAGDGTIDLAFSPVKSVNGNVPDPSTGDVTLVIPPPPIGLITPTKITNATDFNTLQTVGLYFALDADAASLVNAPNTASGGTLDVEPFTTTGTGGDVIQRYNQAGNLYFRRYTQSSNTWSPWVRVANSTAPTIATTSVLGSVIIGAGLNVSGTGLLSTQIQTVNGHSDQNIVLTATDVAAVPTISLGAAGGVAVLDATAVTPIPATDPYTYGRLPFYENTLGTWQTAGVWDASANHVIQARSTIVTSDTNTALLANGKHLIDIAYGGNGLPVLASPDYQTVSAEGMAYVVSVAGTTSLDGIASWAVGDLAVAVNGKWIRIAKPYVLPVASASVLGGVKQGSNVTIAGDGTISVAAPYTLPVATASVLGGVKKGAGLDVAGDGTLSATGVANHTLSPTSGFRQNPDGTIEIWGSMTFPSGTNSINVTLPVAIPTEVLKYSFGDGGASCFPYGMSVVDSTHITLYAPVYWVDNTGAINLRAAATGSWSMLVH